MVFLSLGEVLFSVQKKLKILITRSKENRTCCNGQRFVAKERQKSGKLKTLRKIHFNFSTTHRASGAQKKKPQSEPDRTAFNKGNRSWSWSCSWRRSQSQLLLLLCDEHDESVNGLWLTNQSHST